jgi:hypothetical protein
MNAQLLPTISHIILPRFQVDMTGSGLSGGGRTPAPPPPSSTTITPRPYRTGVTGNVMDMNAFVTDMKGYWPLASTAGAKYSTVWRQWHAVGTVFLLASLALFWG